MTLPIEFYYTKQDEGLIFTHEPQGDLDVDRLIKNQACWRTQDFLRTVKPKTLIITDWRAPNWTSGQVMESIEVANQLIKENFELYLWQDGQFLAITLNNNPLDEELFRKKITPISADNALKKASRRLNLPADCIHVLDDYWMDWLKTRDPILPARHLCISDYRYHRAMQEQILQIILQAKPTLSKIILKEFSRDAIYDFNKMQETLQALPCVDTISRLDITCGDIEKLLHGDIIKKNTIEFSLKNLDNILTCILSGIHSWELPDNSHQLIRSHYKHLSLNCFPKSPECYIQSLDFHALELLEIKKTNLDRDDIRHLLKAPKLKTFIFNPTKEQVSTHLTENLSLSSITTLEIHEHTLQAEDLHWFLSHKLKSLSIYFSTLPDINLSQSLEFSALRSLILDSSNISQSNLAHLLKTAVNLHYLWLQSLKNDLLAPLPSLYLPYLTNCNLHGLNISAENLHTLLKNSQCLETVNITGVIHNSAPVFQGVLLDHLKTLTVTTNLSEEDVHYILQNSPELTYLNLNANKNLHIPFPATLNCPKLKHLSLNNSSISTKNLEKILIQAPKLLNLELFNCRNLDRKFNHSFRLPWLETLDVENSNLHFHNFMQIVTSACCLKKLSIINYMEIQPNYIKSLSFPDLEKLYISGSQILSIADLNKLFETSPKLSLFSAEGISPSIVDVIRHHVFPAIETLYICNNQLSNADMIDMIIAMPNLTRLHLTGSTNLDLRDSVLKSLLEKITCVYGIEEIENLANDNALVPSPKLPKKIARHNPDEFLSIKPTPSNFKFHFTGKNKTKNQKMIIEKLSQYLILSKKDQRIIPEIQDGICAALSQLFIDCNEKKWGDFIDSLSNWNGRHHTLDDSLKNTFDCLLTYVKDWHISPKTPVITTYIGEGFADAIETLPMPCIIYNSWHSVALKKTASGWVFYDPNREKGIKICSTDELLRTIKSRLGMHISIKGFYPELKPAITSPDEFIATGGLLSLCFAINKQDILTLLTLPIHPRALNGLLLCDMRGRPAWIIALNEPIISTYVGDLLQKYQQSCSYSTPNLMASIANIPAIDYLKAFDNFKKIFPPELINNLQKIFLDATENSSHFDSRFETWEKEKSVSDLPEEYCKNLIFSSEKKQLIELSQNKDVFDLHYLLEKQALAINTPIYYIDSPADLICSAPFIKRQGNRGILTEGPGGFFYDFLNLYRNSDRKPIILINYTGFKPQDIVHFNNMLDDCSCVDGTPLPDNIRIIGLINPDDPDNYQGEDFYSRFDKVSVCPFKDSMLAECIPPLPLLTEKVQDSETIELFNAGNWEERLMGRWKIQKDTLYFEEGALQKALEQNKPLHIQNGSWENPHFCAFWRMALLRGYIDYAGQRTHLPASLPFSRRQGYDEQYLSANTACYEGLTDTPHIFNPSFFGRFFTRYHCDNKSKTLESRTGILDDYADKHLHINVTRSMADQEWAIFLQECQQKNIELHCHFAPGVNIPTLLQSIPLQSNGHVFKQSPSAHTQLFSTGDIDACLKQFTSMASDWMIIDVSECKPAHLLQSLSGNLNKESLCFEFHEKGSLLETALAEGKKIILTGPSQELADHLSPILLSRQQTDSPQGQLVVLTNTNHPFNYLDVTHHDVSREDKHKILIQSFTANELEAISDELWIKEPLIRLEVILRQRQRYAGLPDDSAWEGMESLPEKVRLNPFDIENSKQIAMDFVQKRLEKVHNSLNNSPFVCLTGLTAVGKTTFVQTVLHQKETSNLYQGEQQFKAWASDKSDKQKLLFIDEANMANRNWSEFEGMFHNPPAIMFGGEYFLLDSKHKVVFASNPVNYGNGRCLPTLFQRHGNAVLCCLMPMEYIYETQLKPVFQSTHLEQYTDAISKDIMSLYQFILECSETELLISPRELQMIVLLTLSQSQASEKPLETARFYARTVARPLVPPRYLLAFDEKFPPVAKEALVQTVDYQSQEEFIDTKERANIKNLIEDCLRLHQFRRQQARNDLQAYGGLGGLILEGAPGIGKTELVRHCLKNVNIPFSMMPISMRLSDKIKLLLNAFDKGTVVVIDEINSSPMLERLLNDLLMGKSPEGQRPSQPGFMIIGTQNPVTMKGRNKPAAAMARRFLTVSVPEYTQPEMQLILTSKGLSPETSEKLTKSYIKQKCLAEKNGFKPVPTFRDLLRVTNGILQMGKNLRSFSIWSKNESTSSSRAEREPEKVMDFSA